MEKITVQSTKKVLREKVSTFENAQKERIINACNSSMKYADVLKFIEGEIEQSKKQTNFRYSLKCWKTDGAYQFNRAIQEIFGTANAKADSTPSGDSTIETLDVIFADGGITQIRAIKNAINKYENLDIKVFGMVKNDKHQTRALMNENRKELKISPKLMNLITQFQDTVHDTAISYHRKLRDKAITKSELDDIQGIGKVKKQALLKKFGSVEKIKQASIEELMEVKGINKELAEKIKNI